MMRDNPTTFPRSIVWILRLTVALQCLGNARWFLEIEETPLLALMWGQPDVGGFGWQEGTALAIQHGIGWCLVAAAICVILRPCVWVCGPLTILQLAIALALGYMNQNYFIRVDWISPPVAILLTLATQAARIAAPIGLLLFDPWRATQRLRQSFALFGDTLLRWAIGLTFFAHGLEAIGPHPHFVDLLILGIERLTDWRMSQSMAEGWLTVIGIVDILVGAAAVTLRMPSVAYYMTFWGFVTAASRMLAFGFISQWHEVATRASHFGIPLVLAFYWLHIEKDRNDDSKGADDEYK